MLDLVKLARQMQDIGQHLNDEAAATRQRLDRAQMLLQEARGRQTELVNLRQMWGDRLGFSAAIPQEPLDTCISLTPAPPQHTVLATDGSQIAPSHHEIAYCYLINVGRIILHYGQNRHPLLDSLPEVFYRPDDLYISRQWGISTEEWMGYRRTASEATVLAELAKGLEEGRGQEAEGRGQKAEGKRLKAGGRRQKAEGGEQGAEGRGQRAEGRGQRAEGVEQELSPHPTPHTPHPTPHTPHPTPIHPSTHPPHTPHPTPHTPHPTPPTLALLDGSLTHWFLDPLPAEARDRILTPILEAWETLRSLRVPLVGYLSAARSGESLNFLRLHTCPKEQPDCQTHCPGQTDLAPCQVFAPLRDTALWSILLKPGQRSAIWRSSARILDWYDHHRTYFCYVNMGSEIARVEFPAWVAEDPELLNRALSLTMTQVEKGQGYPVALAEAHNQAVVRGGDRARFFALLEQQMIRAGLKNVGISYKEARKRGSIA